ncbi:hypothetical protein OAG24_00870 [bacterium]|nr:hypothetical protein [bacterium]
MKVPDITDEILSKLVNLRSLNLGNNTTITDNSLSLLTNLQTLDCGRNKNFFRRYFG